MERTVTITGMTCAGCEETVRDAVLDLPGVDEARVSARHGRAILAGPDLPSDAQVGAALAPTPYRIGRSPWLTRDGRVWHQVAIATAVVSVAAWALVASGAAQTVNSWTGLASSGSLVMIALLGVVASVSTCAAVVGAVAMGLGASLPADASPATRWGTQAAFNIGRVVGFGVLGAVMGAVGSALALKPAVIAVALIASAVVMALVGVRLTGVSPRIAQWQVSLPARWGRWARRDQSPRSGQAGFVRAALLGGATFVLPCGFTQAVQLYAVGTSSPAQAALVMAVFALGTTPGLMALGLASALRLRGMTTRAVGVLALGFAGVIAVSVVQPWVGSSGPAHAPLASAPTDNVDMVDGVQHVTTEITLRGYSPADTVVYVGEPVEWTFVPAEVSCAGMLYLDWADAGLVKALWEPQTVTFTPTEVGVYEYECWMGMYTGTFAVIERPL